MTVYPDIIIQAKNCSCEFAVTIDYFYRSPDDVVAWNPSFFMDAKLINICITHEKEARVQALKKVKHEESEHAYLNAAPLLKDLEREIKIVKYSDYILRMK